MKAKASKVRGRPRAFDADAALDKAMRVFWKNGYEGASLPELTAAMGINRPSLYAAFGNKEQLFRKSLDRYIAQAGGVLCEALQLPTARQVVERLLRSAIGKPGRGEMRGCLLVHGALACSESSEPIRRELASRRFGTEHVLKQRFERAVAENDLPANADPAALAKFFATFQQGLAVQTSSGANRDELSRAVDVALRALPRV